MFINTRRSSSYSTTQLVFLKTCFSMPILFIASTTTTNIVVAIVAIVVTIIIWLRIVYEMIINIDYIASVCECFSTHLLVSTRI